MAAQVWFGGRRLVSFSQEDGLDVKDMYVVPAYHLPLSPFMLIFVWGQDHTSLKAEAIEPDLLTNLLM